MDNRTISTYMKIKMGMYAVILFELYILIDGYKSGSTFGMVVGSWSIIMMVLEINDINHRLHTR